MPQVFSPVPATQSSDAEVTVVLFGATGGEACLASVRSLLGQTLAGVKVFVFVHPDDGQAGARLAELEDARLVVRAIPEEGGEAAAWNSVVRDSKTPFVACQGSGDLSHPERLALERERLLADSELAGVFVRHDLLVARGAVAPCSGAGSRLDCRRAIARMASPGHPGTGMFRRSQVLSFERNGRLGGAAELDWILRVGETLPLEVLGECLYSRRIPVAEEVPVDVLLIACREACVRRGLPPEHGAWFVETPERAADARAAAHFSESCAERVRAGKRIEAFQGALTCASLQPFDRSHYGPLGRTVLPRVLLDGLARPERSSPSAPVHASGADTSTFEGGAPLSLESPLRLCLFGAAGDTGNLGVSALMHSTLAGIARFAPETSLTVFDNGWGERDAVALAAGREFFYRRIGARLSRRYHRPESFWNMQMSARTTAAFNPGLRAIRDADAVLDLSGGDSFADIYGERHLEAILAPKRLALSLGRPLVLMPQTYGPFRSTSSRAAAAKVLRGSRLAWARDERSFDAMKALIGSAFDPRRHRVGVDVAFALERYAPRTPLPEPVAEWIEGGEKPLVGINVSGLLWNDPKAARKYELRVDYRAFLSGLVRRFLETTEVRIVLVSHVIPTEVLSESDPRAARELRDSLTQEEAERVAVLPEDFDQSETKWVISNLDWFTGARMHATIGAISSGVPTAGLAYSIKIRGVFATCGVEHDVVDLRELETIAALEATWRTFEERGASWEILHERVPAVRARALEEIHETLTVLSEDR